MNEITITLTLQEAATICRVLIKADPLGIYHTEIVKKIDGVAMNSMQEMKPSPVKGNP